MSTLCPEKGAIILFVHNFANCLLTHFQNSLTQRLSSKFVIVIITDAIYVKRVSTLSCKISGNFITQGGQWPLFCINVYALVMPQKTVTLQKSYGMILKGLHADWCNVNQSRCTAV